MRYIISYRLFENKRIDLIDRILPNSSAMQDIIALDSKKNYDVGNSGNTIRIDGNKNVKILRNGECVHSKKNFKTLEECLRFIWARIVFIRLSPFIKKKDTFNEVYNLKKYWGERKSMLDIIKLEYPDIALNIDEDIKNINNKLKHFGLYISSKYEEYFFDCQIVMIPHTQLPKYMNPNNIDFFDENTFIHRLIRFMQAYDKEFSDMYVSIYTKWKTIKIQKKTNVEKQIFDFLKRKLDGIFGFYFSNSSNNLNTDPTVELIRQILTVSIDMLSKGKEPIFEDVIAKSITDVNSYRLVSYVKENEPLLYKILVDMKGEQSIDSADKMNSMGF